MPPGKYERKPWFRSNTGGTLIPAGTRREILNARLEGLSLAEIAKRFRCSRSSVSRISWEEMTMDMMRKALERS